MLQPCTRLFTRPRTLQRLANRAGPVTRQAAAPPASSCPSNAVHTATRKPRLPTSTHSLSNPYRRASNMSDDAYAAFLDKAAADAAPANTSSADTRQQHKTVTTSSLHPALSSLSTDRVYVTDADEPFRPVSLPISGKSLSDKSVAAAIKDATGKQVSGLEVLSVQDWDPRGEYKDVVQKVAEAAGTKESEVKVFRADEAGARVDYWIVGLDQGEGLLKGFVATGVES